MLSGDLSSAANWAVQAPAWLGVHSCCHWWGNRSYSSKWGQRWLPRCGTQCQAATQCSMFGRSSSRVDIVTSCLSVRSVLVMMMQMRIAIMTILNLVFFWSVRGWPWYMHKNTRARMWWWCGCWWIENIDYYKGREIHRSVRWNIMEY